MLDNNDTTEIYARTLRRNETYLTVEGPYRTHSDFAVLIALIVVISVVSVVLWRCM